MYRYILICLLLIPLKLTAAPLQQLTEIGDALSHAEALYYEARFTESIQLLTRIDQVLTSARLKEKAAVKLQLALAHIGLNEGDPAKTFLRELFALDPAYRLDAQQFSPKVLALAEEARVEEDAIRCEKAQTEADNQLTAKDTAKLLELIASMKPTCPALTAFEPAAADLLYKSGLDSYKRADFTAALETFRQVLKHDPRHDLASQYIELIETRMQVSADRVFVEWQKHMAANDVKLANADYRRLKSMETVSKHQVVEMDSEYRKRLLEHLEMWKLACASGDSVRMDALRSAAADMLPEAAIGDDIVTQMSNCVSPGCLQMSAPLALARIKVRVDPEVPHGLNEALKHSPIMVRTALRIDEKGNASVQPLSGGNPLANEAVRTAVERWKFTPVLDASGARCVETEIPIIFKRQTN